MCAMIYGQGDTILSLIPIMMVISLDLPCTLHAFGSGSGLLCLVASYEVELNWIIRKHRK